MTCLAQQKVEDAHLAIAHRLGLHYLILQSPAMHNIRYSAALRVLSPPTMRQSPDG